VPKFCDREDALDAAGQRRHRCDAKAEQRRGIRSRNDQRKVRFLGRP
jgi:hypothetical protein